MMRLFICILSLLFYAPIVFAAADSSELLFPKNLEYLGAFRPPVETSGNSRWGYGGYAMTYYPGGDSSGADDGYPGSLYGAGHQNHCKVSEISIPIPVKSKDYSKLNFAETLQPFADITNGLLYRKAEAGFAQPDRIGGLLYMPAVQAQHEDQIYWCLFTYYHVFEGEIYSHGRSGLDLSNTQSEGLWHIGDINDVAYSAKSTTGYMFDIPVDWADKYLNGQYIVTGRGGYGSGCSTTIRGPSLYAIAPYKEENILLDKKELNASILLRYPPSNPYPDWSPCDQWYGGAWLTSGKKSAVVIVGTKALGEAYYGSSREGDCSPYKGYHCKPYETQILFYSPSDLLAVSKGEKQSYEVVPYAIMRPDDYFFDACAVSPISTAYDRQHGLFYIFQAYEEHPIIHVFKILSTDVIPDAPALQLDQNGRKINLSWNEVPDAEGYKLFFAPFDFIEKDDAGTLDLKNIFSISLNLWKHGTFFGAINAYNDAGESEISNIVYTYADD